MLKKWVIRSILFYLYILYLYIYIYIYIERERERERKGDNCILGMANNKAEVLQTNL